MSVLFVLLPLGLVLGGGALIACLWAVGRGQFDDMETPALRALFDDDGGAPPKAARDENAQNSRDVS